MVKKYFLLIIIIAIFVASIFVFAMEAKTSQEISLSLNSSNAQNVIGSFEEPFSQTYSVVVRGSRRVTGSPSRQRNPELSPDQLVVIAIDNQGNEVTRIIMTDPRIVRAETIDPSGKLKYYGRFLKDVDFTIFLPDHPAISKIELYHPSWTGEKFILNFVGETHLH